MVGGNLYFSNESMTGFSDGDVTMAYETVRASTGMDLARKLAGFHAQRAVDAICRVAPDSEARDALISICYIVLSRNK